MQLRTQADGLLWARVLATLQIEDGVAWSVNRYEDRVAVGAGESEGSGIATFMRNLIGVNIGILFVEESSGGTRVSMRSERGYDVGTLALELGGGGHTLAAGATLSMPVEEAIPFVVGRAMQVVRQSQQEAA
jgi:phosphoesterase RecJ-like protein